MKHLLVITSAAVLVLGFSSCGTSVKPEKPVTSAQGGTGSKFIGLVPTMENLAP